MILAETITSIFSSIRSLRPYFPPSENSVLCFMSNVLCHFGGSLARSFIFILFFLSVSVCFFYIFKWWVCWLVRLVILGGGSPPFLGLLPSFLGFALLIFGGLLSSFLGGCSSTHFFFSKNELTLV